MSILLALVVTKRVVNISNMALWLARAGSHGEYEQKFLYEGRIYFTWPDLNEDLSKANELAEMYEIFRNVYPDKAAR